jgi:hypothetical protein
MHKENWDAYNPKNSTVLTPEPLCEHIRDMLSHVPYNRIVDLGCNRGNLSRPFLGPKLGLGITPQPEYPGEFILHDLRVTPYPIDATKDDIIITNPPFNGFKKKLANEVVLRGITELWGRSARVVMFAPMGFQLNQRINSTRWQWLRDEAPPITGILSLPLSIFPSVQFHVECLFFNLPVPPHSFLPDSVLWEDDDA